MKNLINKLLRLDYKAINQENEQDTMLMGRTQI